MLVTSGPMSRLKSILLPLARGPLAVDMRAGTNVGALSGLADPHTMEADDGHTLRAFCLDFDALDDPEAPLT